MSKDKVNKFFKIINSYNDFEYLLSIIICNSGPTLKKQKTASLIIFNDNGRKLNKLWDKYKSKVKEKLNVDYFELKKNQNNTIVIFYNYEMLKSNLKDKVNMRFLNRFGYNNEMNLQQCMQLLSERYQNVCPHEIGIFLGYPTEDVVTFVDCPNKECKLIGYWKVYHDIEKAKVIFQAYDLLKQNIIEGILNGYSPIKLIN